MQPADHALDHLRTAYDTPGAHPEHLVALVAAAIAQGGPVPMEDVHAAMELTGSREPRNLHALRIHHHHGMMCTDGPRPPAPTPHTGRALAHLRAHVIDNSSDPYVLAYNALAAIADAIPIRPGVHPGFGPKYATTAAALAVADHARHGAHQLHTNEYRALAATHTRWLDPTADEIAARWRTDPADYLTPAVDHPALAEERIDAITRHHHTVAPDRYDAETNPYGALRALADHYGQAPPAAMTPRTLAAVRHAVLAAPPADPDARRWIHTVGAHLAPAPDDPGIIEWNTVLAATDPNRGTP